MNKHTSRYKLFFQLREKEKKSIVITYIPQKKNLLSQRKKNMINSQTE